MAFDDKPIIDENAERCEESELHIRQFFSMKNGFISRVQTPDYGIDYLVELVSKTKGATSKDFAVQLKSCKEAKEIKIKEETFLSLEFKTSRLGHLCRRPPAYGIIILYNKMNENAYFEYVEEIVNRLTLDRKDDTWKSNEKVNIFFQLKNILNNQTVKNIYDKISLRFKNSDFLTAIHGSFYGIPYLASGIGIENDTNFSNPVQYLIEYGSYLINHSEFKILLNLLSSIPFVTIIRSNELLFVASIVYAQCGYYIEAKTFLSICLTIKTDIDEQKMVLLEMANLRIAITLGQCQFDDYYKMLESLLERTTGNENKLMIESQLLQTKLLTTINKNGPIKKHTVPIVISIKAFFDKVENAGISKEAKQYLKLNCGYYLAEAGFYQYTHDVVKLRMKETLNLNISFQERTDVAYYFLELLEQAHDITEEVYEKAIKEQNDIIQAHALHIIAHIFFQFQFNFYILKIKQNENQSESYKKLFIENIDRALRSAYLFNKNLLLEDAHKELCLTLDINRLYEIYFECKINDFDEQKYLTMLNEIESKTSLKREPSILDTVKPFGTNKTLIPEDSYSDMTDDDINKFSITLLDTMNINEDRLENIKIDLREGRTFYQEKHCNNLMLLQNLEHTRSTETLYANPPLFLFECLIRKWRTADTTNVKELLYKIKSGVCSNCSDESITNK